MTISIFATDARDQEHVGDVATLQEAIQVAIEVLLYHPEGFVDAVGDNDVLLWSAYRETIHDNYVTFSGEINGRANITDRLGK